MRTHATPQQSTERKIIHTVLMVCLGLGFISVAAVYLPHRLTAAKKTVHAKPSFPTQLAAVIPDVAAPKPPVREKSAVEGPVFRFTPAPEPARPPSSSMPVLTAAHPQQELPLRGAESRNVRHNVSSLVNGSTMHAGTTGKRWWTTPSGLEANVAFWKDVYAKYTGSHVALHDPEYLGIIYEVVDLSDIDTNPLLSNGQREKLRRERVGARVARYEEMLDRLAKNPDAALRTKLGRKIAHLFATVDTPGKYKDAVERGVRSQTGQRDKFVAGLRRSGRYLGEIELIFKSYGLPRELTRLIFVESMFQIGARSKVGAAGIWQFMPGTGRKYLRINRYVDERIDPLLATHAAAKLLKHNYERLGTWPLAINAYNAGRGRLAQAVKQLGTNDIGTIIKRFDHRSYGFASRNFFLEFVAAREIVDNAAHYFGAIEYDEPLAYDSLELPFHISLPEVARITAISMDELSELNPALSGKVLTGRMHIPMGTALRIPDGQGDRFLQFASRAPRTSSGPLEHVVARGETLPSIAKMYGVSVTDIKQANPRSTKRKKPRRGQKLYIPFY